MIAVARPLLLAACTLVVLSIPAKAENPDDSLKFYAVHIIEGANAITSGNGVYLGAGLVLTAAHVAAGSVLTIKVGIGRRQIKAEVVKRGQFGGIDLALLSIDEASLPPNLRLRRLPICQEPPHTGEQVIVATPDAITASHVIAPFLLPRDLEPKYRTAISDVATTGNSGSGVFDTEQKCLLGIISAKIREVRKRRDNGRPAEVSYDVAKYFVPSPVIAEFIATDKRP